MRLTLDVTRSGSVPTDKKFTGQRLDDTGLYFYNARYYKNSLLPARHLASPYPVCENALGSGL